ncbi:MAG: pseudaminic acid synthase [Gemmatimonadota bacterium]|nr:pseudaminic acid synthase [Gemmatimonadota bacterium]
MPPRSIKIGIHTIDGDAPPFIIAEMSGNHKGSLERALAIVDAAADAGAHAVKLQTYTADSMTLDINDREFAIRDPGSLWNGLSLYSLYREASMPWDWHGPIFERCKERGLIGFSSPFDAAAVDFLESLGVQLYKIASAEIIDLPLVRKVARTGKPIIMSTGMSSLNELAEAIVAAREGGCRDLAILKCTSVYPAATTSCNVATIPEIQALFDVHVGFSDHTLGIGASIAAVCMGASVIEKHFTTSREDGGVDAAFSATPVELGQLIKESKAAREAIGVVQFAPTEEEQKSLPFRRSLYITADMKAGEAFSSDNLRSIRPGLGLPPKFIEVFMGKRIARNAKKGTALTWDHLS